MFCIMFWAACIVNKIIFLLCTQAVPIDVQGMFNKAAAKYGGGAQGAAEEPRQDAQPSTSQETSKHAEKKENSKSETPSTGLP